MKADRYTESLQHAGQPCPLSVAAQCRTRRSLPGGHLPGDHRAAPGQERIYDGYPDVALEMIGSRVFDDRLQLVEYRPTVLTGPPGTARPSFAD